MFPRLFSFPFLRSMLLVTIPMLAASASAYSLGGVLSPRLCSGSRASALPIMSAAYDFALPALDGSRIDLGDYKGQVSLMVNVASK